jgi:hypothetical protein
MSEMWRRIERRDAAGRLLDWVEVGRCVGCGRGVDREFPAEYRAVGDVLFCRECATRLPPLPAPPPAPGAAPPGPVHRGTASAP